MKQSKLLHKMYADFEKKYATTPEEYGLPLFKFYEDKIILSSSQEVFEAFIASEKLVKKVTSYFLYIILALLGITGFMTFAPADLSSSLMYPITAVVLLLFFAAACIYYRQDRKYEELQEIYCKENALLSYNGRNFYPTKKKHKLYSETAFL